MFRRHALLAAMAGLLLATAASGQDGEKPAEPELIPEARTLLERLDRNGDGRIDADELPAEGRLLVAFDHDGDGALSGSELNHAAFRFAHREQGNSRPRMAESYQADEDSGLFLEAASDYHAGTDGHALVVMKAGEVIFEQYYAGYQADIPHWLASGTKSFSGVMAACAEEDGLLTLDEKAADTLTEWQDDPQKSQITVRQLLNLSSGLDPAKERLQDPAVEDVYAAALEVPMRSQPGRRFRYGPSHYHAFGELLTRKLAKHGETPIDYLQRRILTPIGASWGSWRRDRAGNPNLPGGASFTARQWILFGELVRLGGRWGEEQVVAQELLDRCFEPSAAQRSYGLTWWLHPRAGRAYSWFPADAWAAKGKGKQRLYVIRSQELVIVRFANNGRSFNDVEFLGWLLTGKAPARLGRR